MNKMAKFWARIGLTLDVDNKELEGKSLEEIGQLLENKLREFKKQTDTEEMYIEGDSYFPAWHMMEELIDAKLLNRGLTEDEFGQLMPLEFDL